MDNSTQFSPLIDKYEKVLSKDHKSRVFAPLAEIYRRYGMIEKSLELLQIGIRYNPDYVLGYLALANCYHDLKQSNLAYTTLRPLVSSNRDNIRLQKLFAAVCEDLNYLDEALDTYKYLLFMNPKDQEIASAVQKLEETVVETNSEAVILRGRQERFDIDGISSAPKDPEAEIDEWIQLDLTSKIQEQESEKDPGGFEWKINSQTELIEDYHEDRSTDATPVITHTLVDLYCSQGHFLKAKELLDKILQLNPNDEVTRKKQHEISQLLDEIPEDNQPEGDDPSEGHSSLMEAFDRKFGEVEDFTESGNFVNKLESSLWKFHDALRKKAIEKNP